MTAAIETPDLEGLRHRLASQAHAGMPITGRARYVAFLHALDRLLGGRASR